MQDMIRKGRDNIFGNRKYSFEVLRKSEALRREGYSYSQIAKILGINNAAIKSHLFRHKIEKGNPVPRPRKHGLDLIEKIRLLKAKGLSDVDIYKKLKMSESTFYRMRQAMKGLGA
jgi:DNA-binding CsgD family transcriptional regulator